MELDSTKKPIISKEEYEKQREDNLELMLRLQGSKYNRLQKSINFKYFNPLPLYSVVMDIDSRISELEKQVFKTAKRLRASKTQKALILHHLGVLDQIKQLGISKNSQALLASVLTDSDPDIEKDINNIAAKRPQAISEYNYRFLVDLFEKVGLEDKAKECDKILTKIQREQEKPSKAK